MEKIKNKKEANALIVNDEINEFTNVFLNYTNFKISIFLKKTFRFAQNGYQMLARNLLIWHLKIQN